jgi:hypothetical protein
MKFGCGVCLVRDFEDVVVKGIRVLNGAWISIVLFVELGE